MLSATKFITDFMAHIFRLELHPFSMKVSKTVGLIVDTVSKSINKVSHAIDALNNLNDKV